MVKWSSVGLWPKLAGLYLTAVAAVPLAWLGLQTFAASPVGLGKGWPLTYTLNDFVGIMAACILGPYAVTVFVVVAGNVAAARRAIHPIVRMMLALAHAAAFWTLTVLVYRWGGYDVLGCGIVDCVEGVVDADSR